MVFVDLAEINAAKTKNGRARCMEVDYISITKENITFDTFNIVSVSMIVHLTEVCAKRK